MEMSICWVFERKKRDERERERYRKRENKREREREQTIFEWERKISTGSIYKLFLCTHKQIVVSINVELWVGHYSESRQSFTAQFTKKNWKFQWHTHQGQKKMNEIKRGELHLNFCFVSSVFCVCFSSRPQIRICLRLFLDQTCDSRKGGGQPKVGEIKYEVRER